MKKTTILVIALMFSLFNLVGCGLGADEQEIKENSLVPANETGQDVSLVITDKGETGNSGSALSFEEGEKTSGKEGSQASGEKTSGSEGEVILGDEQFDEYLPLLSGKRVALYTNQTGIVGDEVSYAAPGEAASDNAAAKETATVNKAPDSDNNTAKEADTKNKASASDNNTAKDTALEEPSSSRIGFDSNGNELIFGEHLLDALIERGVDVSLVFSPEHGFRGEAGAGEKVDDSRDPKTGVPIYSIYSSSTGYPPEESADLFDVLMVDIQDVGLRYYTYYIGMFKLMDFCAQAGKEVIVLDRPNPNGFYVDGPILNEEYKSNVGYLPIPVVHGLTLGEMARMINGEGWLPGGRDVCDLIVIPCKNYTHDKKTALIEKPSPNLKTMRAVYLYASTCFFENTVVSVGRGTQSPFEIFGSPYFKEFGDFNLTFTPKSIDGASNPPYEGEECYGMDLRNIPLKEIWSKGINPEYLIKAYNALQETHPEINFFGKPDKKGRYFIDLLSGSDDLRKQIQEGKSAEEIKESWQEDIEKFSEQRKPYLLYE